MPASRAGSSLEPSIDHADCSPWSREFHADRLVAVADVAQRAGVAVNEENVEGNFSAARRIIGAGNWRPLPMAVAVNIRRPRTTRRGPSDGLWRQRGRGGWEEAEEPQRRIDHQQALGGLGPLAALVVFSHRRNA